MSPSNVMSSPRTSPRSLEARTQGVGEQVASVPPAPVVLRARRRPGAAPAPHALSNPGVV